MDSLGVEMGFQGWVSSRQLHTQILWMNQYSPAMVHVIRNAWHIWKDTYFSFKDTEKFTASFSFSCKS